MLQDMCYDAKYCKCCLIVSCSLVYRKVWGKRPHCRKQPPHKANSPCGVNDPRAGVSRPPRPGGRSPHTLRYTYSLVRVNHQKSLTDDWPFYTHMPSSDSGRHHLSNLPVVTCTAAPSQHQSKAMISTSAPRAALVMCREGCLDCWAG